MLNIIKTKLKDAMILKDKDRVTTLRNILAKLKLKEIEKKDSLTEIESMKVLQTMSKQLNDSIKQYGDAGRRDQIPSYKISGRDQRWPSRFMRSMVGWSYRVKR